MSMHGIFISALLTMLCLPHSALARRRMAMWPLRADHNFKRRLWRR
jgi:hypothetical protein